ncbi:MAG: prepilin-type N-terminal cleavage/methylation domain-containing protein [Xanthomonadaceae bacterium]|jgi:general secretion pathway protein I|nr:prepilin-type N-terminal cleavage/methylation domain-containing protein [Xanthomonadaceae bacterium]
MSLSFPRRQRGFTLIEVIVAFALLALALTLLLGAMSGATRQVRTADRASRATLHAESLLASVGVDAPMEEGRKEGRWDDGRYHWVLEITPYADPRIPPATRPAGMPSSELLQLDLSVTWGEDAGEKLHWRTLRIPR